MTYLFFLKTDLMVLAPSFEQALANQAQFPLYNYIFELYVAGELGRCYVNCT